MKKIKDPVKKKLQDQWANAANGYVLALLNIWELDAYYGYWIGEEIGGVYDYGGGMFTIGMNDIIYCVEHDIGREQYIEWQEYCCDASEFDFDTPNLKSWMMGCPRTDEATFKHLRELKAHLNNAIREEKERVKNEELNNPTNK